VERGTEGAARKGSITPQCGEGQEREGGNGKAHKRYTARHRLKSQRWQRCAKKPRTKNRDEKVNKAGMLIGGLTMEEEGWKEDAQDRGTSIKSMSVLTNNGILREGEGCGSSSTTLMRVHGGSLRSSYLGNLRKSKSFRKKGRGT